MKKGFMYLTAIIDVYSRFIVGWSLHNSLDTSNCIEVLKKAISRHGVPEIINSDQGSIRARNGLTPALSTLK